MSILNAPRRIRSRVLQPGENWFDRSLAERRRAAQDRDAEREAFANDAMVIAVRAVRSATYSVQESEAAAVLEWESKNKPVGAPFGYAMHPQKHAALVAFVSAQKWGDAWLDPIEPTETLDEIKGRLASVARAELAQAEADMQAIERSKTGQ